MNKPDEQYGTCPFCGTPLIYNSEYSAGDDEELLARVCDCPYCGATVEAVEAELDAREGYEYWKNH